MLASLEDVKRRLDIPATDQSQDDAIEGALWAAQNRILQLTGYTMSAETVTDRLERVQLGRRVLLAKRPVTAVTLVRGRAIGETNWTTISYDLIGPDEGKIVLTGTDLNMAWPPSQDPPALWFNWRGQIWPLVEISYTTSALAYDLSEACAYLAAYWRRTELAGPVTSTSLGGMSESYSGLSLPALVREMLTEHIRGGVKWI